MANYPTLTTNPDAEGFKQEPAIDPTLRAEMENGSVVTRAKFTRVPLQYSFVYTLLSNADKVLIETFERDTVKFGSDSFTWVNPIDSVSHTVRFAKPVEFNLANSLLNDWDVRVVIREV